jgi:hypothetical protein
MSSVTLNEEYVRFSMVILRSFTNFPNKIDLSPTFVDEHKHAPNNHSNTYKDWDIDEGSNDFCSLDPCDFFLLIEYFEVK